MKWFQVVSLVALASRLVIQAEAAEPMAAQPKAGSPVLRSSEPSDSVVVKLPGAPVSPNPAVVPPSAPLLVPELLPEPAPATPGPNKLPAVFSTQDVAPKPAPVKSAPPAVHPKPAKPLAEAESNPIAKKPKPTLPPDFAKDSALFCQKQISHWKEADAQSLLGTPLRQRAAYDDNKTVNGTIYAFSDPSGRYKEMELDFDKSTGNLRTVFGYPPQMTWDECLHLWGDKVAAADAKQGRTFYSYLDRRLDVLVDQNGKVISLGMY